MSTNNNSTPPSSRLESVPDWSVLSHEVGHCWWMFTYGLGAMFVISLLLSASLIAWFRHQLIKHQHHLAVITGTLLCSLSIGLFLIIDPHSRWRILPEVVTYLLSQLYKPSVILAFISVQNILIHMSSIRVKTNKFQSSAKLIVLFSVHLFTICSLEVALYFYAEFGIIRIVPEAAFMVLSSYSCLCYIYSGFKLTNYILDTKALDSASVSTGKDTSPEMCKSYSNDTSQFRLRGRHYKENRIESPSKLYQRLRRGQTVSSCILDIDSISTSSTCGLAETQHCGVFSKYDLCTIAAVNLSEPEVDNKVYGIRTSSSVYQNKSYNPPSITFVKSNDTATDPDIESSSKTSENPRKRVLDLKSSISSSESSSMNADMPTSIQHKCSVFDWTTANINNQEKTGSISDENTTVDVQKPGDEEILQIQCDDTLLHCSNNQYGASINDTLAIDDTKTVTLIQFIDRNADSITNDSQFDNIDIGYLADEEICESPGKPVKQHGRRQSTYSVVSAGSTYASNYYQLPKKPPKTCSSFSLLRVRQCLVLQKVVPVVYWVTFVMIVNIIFELYALFGVYGILGTGRSPKPWPWFLFQVLHRSVELLLVVMLQVAMVMLLGNRHYRRHRRRTKQLTANRIADNHQKRILP